MTRSTHSCYYHRLCGLTYMLKLNLAKWFVGCIFFLALPCVNCSVTQIKPVLTETVENPHAGFEACTETSAKPSAQPATTMTSGGGGTPMGPEWAWTGRSLRYSYLSTLQKCCSVCNVCCNPEWQERYLPDDKLHRQHLQRKETMFTGPNSCVE